MKRHSVLTPLSREHHEALILSRLIQIGAPLYKGLPKVPTEKAKYAANLFTSKLKIHFLVEEKMLDELGAKNDALQNLFNEIRSEHISLELKFQQLKQENDLVQNLDELGKELEAHIRKEERILFELLQENYTDEELDKLKTIIH